MKCLLITFILIRPIFSLLAVADAAKDGNLEKAIFAGGCFWCMQPPFDQLEGVVSTKVGYTGGRSVDPTYEQVAGGRTGHVEAIEILYDPKKISYEKLLLIFWHNIDPTDNKGQFCDKGTSYRSVIFPYNEQQRQQAETSKQQLIQANEISPILTEIIPASPFFPAAEYHQKYYQKNPFRYRFYRYLGGRDKRLKEIWSDSDTLLRSESHF